MKAKKLNKQEVEERIKRWKLEGLIFGVIMFLLIDIIIPLFSEEGIREFSYLLKSLPIWLIGGLGYGFYMKWFLTRKLKKMEKK